MSKRLRCPELGPGTENPGKQETRVRSVNRVYSAASWVLTEVLSCRRCRPREN